jgi:complement component 1 Q subcomponent-binding protein
MIANTRVRITVTFSIADLQNYDSDSFDQDPALGEDDMDGERSAADQESMEDDMGPGEGPMAVRLNVVVEKPGKGALNVEASAQDGNIVVENMYYYADAKLAHNETAEAAHTAQNIYPGPPFGSLDEDLQILLERYLEERGITQALALFVPDYMEIKEQKEYLAWLNNVKAFVDV